MSVTLGFVMTIDVRKVIKRFGGRTILWKKIIASGDECHIRTIDKWIENDSIPTVRLMQLKTLADKDGFKFKIDDFLKQ